MLEIVIVRVDTSGIRPCFGATRDLKSEYERVLISSRYVPSGPSEAGPRTVGFDIDGH